MGNRIEQQKLQAVKALQTRRICMIYILNETPKIKPDKSTQSMFHFSCSFNHVPEICLLKNIKSTTSYF